MARYKVLIKPSAVKELKKIPKQHLRRITKRIKALADQPLPDGCEKLSGHDRYKIRQGSYRIVYSIQDKKLIVFVVKVGHRRDVNRDSGA